MNAILRRILCLFLALTMIGSPLSISAEGLTDEPEETEIVEETAEPEETEAPDETEEAEPEETEESASAETEKPEESAPFEEPEEEQASDLGDTSEISAVMLSSGKLGDNLSWQLSRDGILKISGNGAMPDFYSWTTPWDSYKDNILAITIEDGVTNIGNFAFAYCTELTGANLGSVKRIGNSAFEGCTNLQSISVPDSTESIGAAAFTDCENLHVITIGTGVRKIYGEAFGGCGNLQFLRISDLSAWLKIEFSDCYSNPLCDYGKTNTEVYLNGSRLRSLTIPAGTGSIPNWAFCNWDNITSVTIPDSVTTIGFGSFWMCRSIKSADLGNGVKLIDWSAFNACEKLSSIIIPACIESINRFAFDGCTSLTNVYYQGSEANWKAIRIDIGNDCLTEAAIYYSGSTEPTPGKVDWSLKNGVLTISGRGSTEKWSIAPWYASAKDVRSVVIEDGITDIADGLFSGCENLKSVSIGKGVTDIGSGAFPGTAEKLYISSLKSWLEITMADEYSNPLGNTFAPTEVYVHNVLLEELIIPAGVTEIKDYACRNWDCITSVVIPDSVTAIGDYAFDECSSLKSAKIGNGVISIGIMAFASCDSLISIQIPDSVTSLGDYAFMWCHGLTDVIIGNNVPRIGYYTFYVCQNLTSITIGAKVTSIGDYAFHSCWMLKDIYYQGSRYAWAKMQIGYSNDCLNYATKHFEGKISRELSTIDYIAFSNAAYIGWSQGVTIHDGYQGYWDKPALNSASRKDIITGDLYENIEDWKVIFTSTDWKNDRHSKTRQLDTGFYAVTFEGRTEKGKQYVFAYRGTDFNFDILQDTDDDIGSVILHNYVNQLQDAQNYYEYCMEKLGLDPKEQHSNVSATGHSLGGGLAIAVSMIYGIRAEGFNSASVQEAVYYNVPELAGRRFEGLDKWNFTAHVIDGDIIGGFWKEYKSLKYIRYQQSSLSDTDGWFPKHSLHNFLEIKDGKLCLTPVISKGQDTTDTKNFFPRLAMGTSAGEDLKIGSGVRGATLYGGAGDDHLIRTGWVDDELVGGRSGIFGDILDGSWGDDTYYYFKGDGVHYIRDSSGDDTICLEGFDSGDRVEFDSGYSYWDSGRVVPAYGILVNNRIIIYIDASHNGKILLQQGGKTMELVNKKGHLVTKNYIIACPVYVEIYDKEGNLLHTLEHNGDEAVYTPYGNFYVFTDENGESVKTIDLFEDYDIRIRGVDDGSMNVACRLNEGEPLSQQDVPVTAAMTATITENEVPFLIMDDDSDGTADRALSMSGIVPEDTLRLSQSYLALTVGAKTQLDVSTAYPDLLPMLTWSVVNADDNSRTVITLDNDGTVTAVSAGTAYAVISVEIGGELYSVRCRVDVVEGRGEHPIAAEVKANDADLLDTKATVELFKTDYAKVGILLNFAQNMTVSSTEDAPADLGAAIEGARFSDGEVNDLFRLRVKDDRTLEIVPREDAVRNPAVVMSSYKSTVMVAVDGTVFETAELTLTVKKTQPKLKVSAVRINSFDPMPAEIAFTGGKVTALEAAGTLPAGFALDGLNVVYTGTAAKTSAKLNLLAEVVGWAVQVPVTVSVSVSRTEPTIYLTAPQDVTLRAAVSTMPAESAADTQCADLKPFDIIIFKPLDPAAPAAPAAGAPASAAPKKASVKKITSVTLQPGIPDMVQLKVNITPSAFEDREIEMYLTDSKGNAADEGVLDYRINDGILQVTATGNTPRGATLKLTLNAAGSGKKTVLTIKTAKAKPAISVKASGTIDTAVEGSTITLKTGVSNYHIGNGEMYLIRVERVSGKPAVKEDVSASFRAVWNDGTISLTAVRLLEKGGTYSAAVGVDLDGDNIPDSEKTVKLKIKWSAPSKVPVSVTLKASGKIDMVKPGTAVKVKPTIRNWFLHSISASDLVFYKNGVKLEEAPFHVSVENGAYVITDNGADNSAKYTVAFSAELGGKIVTSKAVPVGMKMSTPKMLQSTRSVTLLKKDRYDSAIVHLDVPEGFTGIASVQQDKTSAALYTVSDLGGGDYAIGFANHRAAAKGATVKLQVFLQGNLTAKANVNVSVKVTLK